MSIIDMLLNPHLTSCIFFVKKSKIAPIRILILCLFCYLCKSLQFARLLISRIQVNNATD